MTERQAWWKIAKAYSTYPNVRTREQLELTEWGICSAIEDLCLERLLEKRMIDKIFQSMPPIRYDRFYFCRYRFDGPYCGSRRKSRDTISQCDEWRADYCFAMYYSNGAE